MQTNPSKLEISVVIPARNEEECLPPVIAELKKYPVINEIIVIDGYSTDATAQVSKNAGAQVFSQEGGRGYGLGVMTGLKHARGEWISFVDADGSYDPEAIVQMKKEAAKGYDVIFCSRYRKESGSDDDTWIRWVGNKSFTLAMRLLFGVRITDSLFLYVLAKKSVVESLKMESSGFEWCMEFPIRVHHAGYRYTEIPSRERPRLAGESKVNAFWDGLKILSFMLRLRLKLWFESPKSTTAHSMY